MGIRILNPGLLTTVQDLGRTGYQSQGFPVAGVMDRRAFRIANLLVNNAENEAVMEFAVMGPTLEFTAPTNIAITGGNFSPTINGSPAAMYMALRVRKGDVLAFSRAKTGNYGYIAFSSCLDIPLVMGSRSTNLKSELGGFQGRKLQKGDCIPFRSTHLSRPFVHPRRVYPELYRETLITLRVIPGPQASAFTQEGIEAFLHSEFTVTNQFDRMGCRLDGPSIATENGSDIISDGISFGSIQVPSHGKPIILLADRQTTGGYAKIATVCSVDLPKLVQSRAGTRVRFQAISVQQAQQLLMEDEQRLQQLLWSEK